MVSRHRKILSRRNGEILFVTINRPDRGNSIDGNTAKTLARLFKDARRNAKIKAVTLSANGKNFCTGADLKWMSRGKNQSEAQNLKDMLKFVEMYSAILNVNKPLFAHVRGKVLGGGVGLVACCDFVICEDNAVFALPEATLGLSPGIITPIVTRKIGARRFNELAKGKKRLTAIQAKRVGLVQKIIKSGSSEQKFETFNQPDIQKGLKLKRAKRISERTLKKFAAASAKKRASTDAQSKITDFLNG